MSHARDPVHLATYRVRSLKGCGRRWIVDGPDRFGDRMVRIGTVEEVRHPEDDEHDGSVEYEYRLDGSRESRTVSHYPTAIGDLIALSISEEAILWVER